MPGNLSSPLTVSLAEKYLADRGLPLPIAQVNGVEIDLHPDRAKIEERLGAGCIAVWTFAAEVLWFPLYNKKRERVSWLARGLPTIGGNPKFVCPTKSSGLPTGLPYIPIRVWHEIGKPSRPIHPAHLEGKSVSGASSCAPKTQS